MFDETRGYVVLQSNCHCCLAEPHRNPRPPIFTLRQPSRRRGLAGASDPLAAIILVICNENGRDEASKTRGGRKRPKPNLTVNNQETSGNHLLFLKHVKPILGTCRSHPKDSPVWQDCISNARASTHRRETSIQ